MTSAPPSTWTRRLDAADGAWRWLCLASSSNSSNDPPVSCASPSLLPRMAFVSRMVAMSPSHPHGRLLFLDAHDLDARVASRGYEISSQDVAIVAEIAALPLAQKHAWFREQAAALLKPWADGHVKMRVRRSTVLVDSMEQLLGVQFEHIHLHMKILLELEQGSSAARETTPGEWLALVADAVFEDKNGLFTRVPSVNAKQPPRWTISASSREATGDHLLYLRGVGRLLGRALLEGLPLGSARLARPLLKHLLAMPITLEDLEVLDPDLFKSLQWIQTNAGVETLGLTFSVATRGEDGVIQVVDLKDKGRAIAVTEDNKHEYVTLRLQHAMLGAFAEQLQHVMIGLFEVVPQEIILPFTVDELERIIYETPALDRELEEQKIGASLRNKRDLWDQP